MDIKKEIEQSFIEIRDSNDNDTDTLVEKDLIMRLLDIFEDNKNKKDDKALTNLIISELENYSKDSND